MDSRATPLDMDFAFSIASTEIFEVCVCSLHFLTETIASQPLGTRLGAFVVITIEYYCPYSSIC